MLRAPVAGFSLIEVLISILILSFGALGAVALQLSALRTTQQSAFHTSAVHLANDLAEKIRVNHLQSKAAANPYLFSYDANSDGTPGATSCYTQNCDSAALAAADIAEWKNQLSTALPGGRVIVCRDSAPFHAGKQRLQWNCSGTADAPITIKIGWRSKNPDGSADIDDDGKLPPSVALSVESYQK
jgi:type IV pilus assembly protein PilV